MAQEDASKQASPILYPTGHLNHLSHQQEQALEAFRELCVANGCYVPVGNGHQTSHDDETLLRFLRARKFIPQDALKQFKTTEDWRKEQNLDDSYDTIDVDEYEATSQLYPHWTGRRDKQGIPICVFDVGNLNSKKLSALDSSISKPRSPSRSALSPTQLHLFATYEHLINFIFPLCSCDPKRQYPETPISQTCDIVDVSGFALRQFWGLKAMMKEAVALSEAHYPETSGRTFIIGAPSFFPSVWHWVKYWLDPVTVAKMYILSDAEVKPTLERYIDEENIPKKYGGKLDWEAGNPPSLDPDLAKLMNLDGGATIPTGPMRWKKSQDGDHVEARALGTVSGKPRDEVVAQVSVEVFEKSLFVL
ncbi:hypothetical protein M409DRAFT_68719 [Zasmidium cellare ATCC 36951]|uniref:CRAL-TRIO domain-containing protein n=1 Tax=Zasmidium cellare ATCC 36951 TaxID=1080233 RepID=A0A6A6C7R7_ZASCE|nr:uncharacterized protein M409DRAFT_68719 [Zasmidium cellare ATCC 36951]KAF2163091.1 hypothetical protein M409DRAFT_68719 [Zasmidium cellare ATCC 36951]